MFTSLNNGPYGFRKGHDTSHVIVDFLGKLTRSYKGRDECLGIFCDLSKAFETINHSILLEKLRHYGIDGIAGRLPYVSLNSFYQSQPVCLRKVYQG
jgi:hypothetical protein